MQDLVIERRGETLVIDSRLVAARMGIEHESLMKTVNTHKSKIEKRFGILRFQIGEFKGRGQPEKFIFLTEDQALFIGTLSRNNERVVDFKADLVEAFSKARKSGFTPAPVAPQLSPPQLNLADATRLIEVSSTASKDYSDRGNLQMAQTLDVFLGNALFLLTQNMTGALFMPYFNLYDDLTRRYQVVFREKNPPENLIAGPFDSEAEALNNLAQSAGLNNWQLGRAMHWAGIETAPKTISYWASKGETPPTTRSGRPIPFHRYNPETRLWKPALPAHLARLVEDFDFLTCPRCGYLYR